jgi:molybdenum cofactor guanylyltransferase
LRLGAAIIAGGEARRLGPAIRHKGLLPSGPEAGAPSIVGRLIELLTPRVDLPPIISTNDPAAFAPFGLEAVPDVEPDRGPLEGIRCSLAHSKADALLLLPGDAPGAEGSLLDLLLEEARRTPGRAILLRYEGIPQPFFSVVPRSAGPAIESALSAGPASPRRALAKLTGARILEPSLWRPRDPEARSFYNLNSPKDLEELLGAARARALLAEQASKDEPCST